MFQSIARRACAGFVLLVCATLPVGAAQGQPAKSGKSPTSVRFIDAPSSESPAARRARLKKECKGRPNAGACLGHTR
jgi:hypothetical protein